MVMVLLGKGNVVAGLDVAPLGVVGFDVSFNVVVRI
jgi:hypothetical protein